MNSNSDSDAVLEIGRKLYPRRRRRYGDLRTYEAACAWARALDWRQNPYDRFLLRRELLHFVETADHLVSLQKAVRLAGPGEIAAVIDQLLDTLPPQREALSGVFTAVFLRLPWEIAHRHGRLRYSALTKALQAA